MRKLRVGVWVDNKLDQENGGSYWYQETIIGHLSKHTFKDASILFISYDLFTHKPQLTNNCYTIKWRAINPSNLKIWQISLNKISSLLGFKFFKTDFSKEIKENNADLQKELSSIIDIIYYPVQHYYSGLTIPNFPFICTLWDLGHLNTYAFPEVSMNCIFEPRNLHHIITLQTALAIFCESETGKEETIKYIGINKNRIKIVPIFPSIVIDRSIVSEKPELIDYNSFFIHYPAQFWPHKNHFNLLMAFKKVLVKFPSLKLIFTGSDQGNKEYIKSLIDSIGLRTSVIDMGYISINNLKWLYLNSQGLVMPTFLGPTNMPLIEAAEMGCPVACSDLEGHKEQLGQYALYFNPSNPNNMANCIIKMIEDNHNGIKRKYHSKFNISNTLEKIDQAFTEIRNIRFCWGTKYESS